MALPRKITLQLNYFELGALIGVIPEQKMKDIKRDFPILWNQLRMWFVSAYAFDKTHFNHKQALKDYGIYKGAFKRLLKKEREEEK